MNEQQMAMLVERAGETLEPDVQALVVAGVARGRARRRRRALGSALGATAVVGAVALTAALLPRGPDPTSVATGSVARDDMSSTLATLLPGATVVEDGERFQFQVQRGTVQWHGARVSLALDTRSVGTSTSARERCQVFMGRNCIEAGGGVWVAENGTVELDSRTGEETARLDVVRAYVPGGYTIEAAGESGTPAGDRSLLRRLVLDEVWLD
jgi:hypothetical protein